MRTGDKYDDTDPSGRIQSGRNARLLGEPTRFSYQAIAPADAVKFNEGLALAKVKVAAAIRQLAADLVLIRAAAPPSARLTTALEVAFNAAPTLPDADKASLVANLHAGLLRLLTGLNSDGLKVISTATASTYMYGIKSTVGNCTGFVPRGLTESGGRGTAATGTDDLGAVSGEIHLIPGLMNNVNMVADTLIHEGCHKFLGAWDYSYVGVAGGAAAKLATKAGELQMADGALTAPAAHQLAKDRAPLNLVAGMIGTMVGNAFNDVLPVMLRNRPVALSDAPEVKVAKRVWAMVRLWGQPAIAPPPQLEIDATVAAIIAQQDVPAGLVAELRKYSADPMKYLAEKGNDLNAKNADVMLTLPTGFLLKNADSWTELATTVAP